MEHGWICLRCDWTGGKTGAACPRCGAPLYRVQEPTGDPMPSSPVDTVQDDASVPPAVPVAARRRWSVIGGGALTVAAVLIVATGLPFDRAQTPADKPTRNPEGKTAEEVATDFVYEIAFFETDLAVRHLANDHAVARLGLDGIGEFRRWLSFNEATGFQVIPTSCEKTGSSSLGTYVRCMFDFHTLRSEAIGRGPYSGSYFDLVVHETPQEWGAIRDVSGTVELAKVVPEMWDPFTEWVSTTYPQDVTVMYDNLRNYRMTPRSIRLWEQHTREYVEAVQQGKA